jgi:hypothetical protein
MQWLRRVGIAALCVLGLVVSASVQAQQTATKLLPNDTEMVMTFNIQQIGNSEIIKQNDTLVKLVKAQIEQGLEDQGLAKHLKKANFDLFRDLNSVTVAVPGDRAVEEGFFILEGNFDADKIEEAAKGAGTGFKVLRIPNVKAFEVSQEGQKTLYVAVLDKKTMIGCISKNDFTDAIARFNGTKSQTLKADVIKKLMPTVNNKQSFSMIATTKVLGALSESKLGENAPQGAVDQAKKFAEFLKTADGVSMSVTIDKNIDLQVGLNAKEAKTATEYAALVNFFLNGAKEKAKKDAKDDEKAKLASDFLETVRATAEGPNLMIRAQVTADTLDKILQNLPLPK